MTVEQRYLTPNRYSRGQGAMAPFEPGVSALVLHWTAVPGQGADAVWRWWDGMATSDSPRYGSTHTIADEDRLLEVMPYTERAYHVGSARGYSAYAAARFGEANVSSTGSPNRSCLGIEMCVETYEGEISDGTWGTTVEWLVARCQEHAGYDPYRDIITHNMVVDWKDCPRWMVRFPSELERMRREVAAEL